MSTPCSNHGDCIDLPHNTYLCICTSGYTGVDCEIDIDDCNSSLCYYGNCTDVVDGFICDCEQSYEGNQCHISE